MLSIAGALQGLPYNADLMTYMDFWDSLKQVLSTSLDGGLKLFEIHTRYKFTYIQFLSIKYLLGSFQGLSMLKPRQWLAVLLSEWNKENILFLVLKT